MTRGQAARQRRIRRRADFQKVYRAGFRVSGTYLVVFAMVRRESPEPGPRLGITATRKIGSAVVRSRCKRRVRELYRLSGVLDWPWPVDLVVNVKRGCDEAPWAVLVDDWSRLSDRIAEGIQRRPSSGERTQRVVK